MGTTFKVQRLDALKQKMRKLPAAVEAGSVDAVKGTAEAIQEKQQDLVPKLTSTLHDAIGIEYSDAGRTAEIGPRGAETYYGFFVEFGTSKMPAQPFVGPSGDVERDPFVERAIDQIRRRLAAL